MTAFPNTRKTLVAGLICLGFSLGAAAQGTSPMPAKAGAHTAGSSVPKEDSNFVHQAAIGLHRDGVLRIELPKAEGTRPASIRVDVAG